MHPTVLFYVLFTGAVIALPVSGLWLFYTLSKLITKGYLENNRLGLYITSTVAASAVFIASLGFLAYVGFIFLGGIYS
jgi:hypothetical protein